MEYDATLGNDSVEWNRDQVTAPPYVSFNTFRTLLGWLKSEGVPLRFDRSFWQSKFSGSTGAQLLAALRFLELLSGDRPLPDLERLVQATTEERRFILKEILRDSYAAVPFGELDRATPAMVRGWFRGYPIAGHTLRKAISFFVNAAKEAETPMSNAVREMARSRTKGPNSGASRQKPDARRALPASSTDRPLKTLAAGQLASSLSQERHQSSRTTIALESGGVVTLGLSVDLFELSEQDREFVLNLVDLTRSYQEQRQTSDTKDTKAP